MFKQIKKLRQPYCKIRGISFAASPYMFKQSYILHAQTPPPNPQKPIQRIFIQKIIYLSLSEYAL